jgi:hypothetical protein
MQEPFKKDWFNVKISLWQKIKLLFIKPTISFDLAQGKDQSVIYEIKRMNGKLYFKKPTCK